MAAVAKRSDLPAVPAGVDRSLRPLLEAMREVVVTGEGHRGDPLDKKITVRDLLGTGLVGTRPGSRPGIGGLVPSNPAPDMSIPPGPGGFQAVSVFGFITLIWDSPAKHYRNHGLTNIYRHTEDNIADAVLVGRTAGFSYNDPVRGDVADAEGFYYWIRWVSNAGVEGPPNSPDGTYVEPTPDIDWLMDKISGEIDESWLAQDLAKRIDLIDGTGPGSVTQRLNTLNSGIQSQMTSIEIQLAEIAGAPTHVPSSTYAAGTLVKSGSSIYRARQAVPANIAITNTTYWQKVGDYASIGEMLTAMGVRMDTVEVTVDEMTGTLASQSEALTALNNRVGAAEGGISGNSEAIQSLNSQVESIGGNVTAQASRFDALRAQVRENDGNSELDDAIRGFQATAQYAEQVKVEATRYEATTTRLTTLDSQVAGNRSSITLLEETVATEKIATAQQIAQLKVTVDGNTSSIGSVSQALASQGELLGQRIDTVSLAAAAAQGAANDANVAIQGEQTARINGDLAQAQATLQLQVKVDGNTSTLQQQATVLNGVSAAYVIKTDVNGLVSGYGLYNDGQTSDFAINVNRFWIGSPNSTVKPFMLVNNVTYLDTAMIRDASIQSGKLGPISFGKLVDASGNPITTVAGKLMAQHIAVDQIEIGFAQVAGDVFSSNYVANQQGWMLRRNGEIEINGTVPGGGRLHISNRAIKVFDFNNIIRVQIGDLSA